MTCLFRGLIIYGSQVVPVPHKNPASAADPNHKIPTKEELAAALTPAMVAELCEYYFQARRSAVLARPTLRTWAWPPACISHTRVHAAWQDFLCFDLAFPPDCISHTICISHTAGLPLLRPRLPARVRRPRRRARRLPAAAHAAAAAATAAAIS